MIQYIIRRPQWQSLLLRIISRRSICSQPVKLNSGKDSPAQVLYKISEMNIIYMSAPVAKWITRSLPKSEITGSNPARCVKKAVTSNVFHLV